MGRIKTSLVKRTAKAMLKEPNKFSGEFGNNSHILNNSMPSKRLRNRIAGYITRLNMNAKKKKEMQTRELQIIE